MYKYLSYIIFAKFTYLIPRRQELSDAFTSQATEFSKHVMNLINSLHLLNIFCINIDIKINACSTDTRCTQTKSHRTAFLDRDENITVRAKL